MVYWYKQIVIFRPIRAVLIFGNISICLVDKEITTSSNTSNNIEKFSSRFFEAISPIFVNALTNEVTLVKTCCAWDCFGRMMAVHESSCMKFNLFLSRISKS